MGFESSHQGGAAIAWGGTYRHDVNVLVDSPGRRRVAMGKKKLRGMEDEYGRPISKVEGGVIDIK